MIIISRRFVTLIEIMIVMFLIALITGVVAYNYRGTLEEGRAFKTKEGIERVKTILLMEIAEQDVEDWSDVETQWQQIVSKSPLAKDPNSLIKDGWGSPYQVRVVEEDGEIDVKVRSERYERYKANRNK